MAILANKKSLSEFDLGHLRYLDGLTRQEVGSWEGFYRTPSEGMNFGLRFQLAFSGYALYGLAQRTPAYRAAYAAPLAALIERMLRFETWAYWFNGAVRSLPLTGQPAPSPGKLQEAVGVAHSRLGLGGTIPADPCQEGNIQYSAHLASLLGFYELLTGDRRYDETGFTLKAEAKGQQFEFHYTHTSLVKRLHEQMQDNHFGGACCEPGRAYAACNNHACISNVLYDELHGTHLAEVNSRWAAWVTNRMLTGGLKDKLPLPAPNGLLSVAYMPDLHLPIPVSFNLTDAWGLAFMAAWEPNIVRQIYPRFVRRLKRGPQDTLYLGSVGPNETVEISTVGLNTAFAALLAREMGDQNTASRLLAWADLELNPTRDPATGVRYYESKPAPYVTALLALAHALPESGNGLYNLLRWRPDFAAPYLNWVSDGVAITQAEVTDNQLEVTLQATPGEPIELELENCPELQQVIFENVAVDLASEAIEVAADKGLCKLKLTPARSESQLKVVFS